MALIGLHTILCAADARLPNVLLIGAKATAKRVHLTMAPMPAGPVRFPPEGKAYRDHPESHRFWRWIALQSPDLVLIAGDDPGGLAEALNQAGITARRVSAEKPLEGMGAVSTDRVSLQDRIARPPGEVARALEPHYGHEFKQAVYIPAMALMARMRMGYADDVRKIALPFVEGQDSLTKPTASHTSGHLLFGELAESTGDQRWTALVRKAADLSFNPDGSMRESMPMHNEMSDSVFMGCPILAKAGKLTGERKYFDMAGRHFRFMAKLDRRPDGLWRHSPLNEAAWGRGNAFPVLGLALTLADFPKDHPDYGELLSSFRALAAALAKHQDRESGMWHQVIDHSESYTEFSSTAMIGRAMLIGIRHGWLNAKEYQPRVDAAWKAVSARTFADGKVMDVCESTGKLPTLQEYLDREAIWAHDPRGGGMALIFAVERMKAGR